MINCAGYYDSLPDPPRIDFCIFDFMSRTATCADASRNADKLNQEFIVVQSLEDTYRLTLKQMDRYVCLSSDHYTEMIKYKRAVERKFQQCLESK